MSAERGKSESVKPPVYVSGGKRLNFSRYAEWGDELREDFIGTGKDDGCIPSCTWEELCALAKLVVDHPAFRLRDEPTTYYPPRIEDEQ